MSCDFFRKRAFAKTVIPEYIMHCVESRGPKGVLRLIKTAFPEKLHEFRDAGLTES